MSKVYRRLVACLAPSLTAKPSEKKPAAAAALIPQAKPLKGILKRNEGTKLEGQRQKPQRKVTFSVAEPQVLRLEKGRDWRLDNEPDNAGRIGYGEEHHERARMEVASRARQDMRNSKPVDIRKEARVVEIVARLKEIDTALCSAGVNQAQVPGHGRDLEAIRHVISKYREAIASAIRWMHKNPGASNHSGLKQELSHYEFSFREHLAAVESQILKEANLSRVMEGVVTKEAVLAKKQPLAPTPSLLQGVVTNEALDDKALQPAPHPPSTRLWATRLPRR
jgi:hypothetical protein